MRSSCAIRSRTSGIRPVQYSTYSASTPESDRRRFEELLKQLRGRRTHLETTAERDRAKLDAGMDVCGRLLAELESIDGEVELLAYERARYLLLRASTELWSAPLRTPGGNADRARLLFQAALNCDRHPIRATKEIQAILVEIAENFRVPLADPRPLFESADPLGIPGQEELFVDYCHPDLLGHRLISQALLQAISRSDIFAPHEEWRFGFEPTWDEYEKRMGMSRESQALSLANRGLFTIGKTYFDAGAEDVLKGAADQFHLALEIDDRCAPALVGLGVLAVLRGETDQALGLLQRAHDIAPQSLVPIEENYRSHPVIRERFEAAGIRFEEGDTRPRRTGG